MQIPKASWFPMKVLTWNCSPLQLGDKSTINVRSPVAAHAYRVFVESERWREFLASPSALVHLFDFRKQAAGLWSIWCWYTCTQSHSLVHAPNQELLVWTDSTEGKLTKQWRPHARLLRLLSWAEATVTAVCRLDSLGSYYSSPNCRLCRCSQRTQRTDLWEAIKRDFWFIECQACSAALLFLLAGCLMTGAPCDFCLGAAVGSFPSLKSD